MNEENYIKNPKEVNEINISKSNNQLEKSLHDEKIKEKNRNTKKSKIKTKIYLNEIGPELLDEIQNSSEELEAWEKIIIMLAICDKTKNINRAKQIVAQNKNIEGLNIKDVNKIMNQIEGKKNIFDFNVYDKILRWELDEKLLDEHRSRQQEMRRAEHKNEVSQGQKIDTSIKSEFSKSDLQLKYEIPEEKIRNNRIKDKKITSMNKEESSSNKIEEEKITYKISKRDIESEIRKIKEIQKKIYVMLQSKDSNEQKKALKAWDISEDKIDKLRRQLRGQDRD